MIVQWGHITLVFNCSVMSDRVLPLIVYMCFTLILLYKYCSLMSHLIVFYQWMVFPPIGHSAILHLETTGLIEHWSFGFAFHR